MCHLSASVIAVFVAATAPCNDALSDGGKKELAMLQGDWVAKEFSRNGEKIDAQNERLILTIKDNKWIFEGVQKGEFTNFDVNSNPKCFDLRSVEEGRKGEIDEAIYRIEGDKLTICLHQGKQKERPTAFETTAERPDTMLAVFQKLKTK